MAENVAVYVNEVQVDDVESTATQPLLPQGEPQEDETPRRSLCDCKVIRNYLLITLGFWILGAAVSLGFPPVFAGIFQEAM